MAKLYLGNNEISNCVKVPVSGESLNVIPSTSAQTLIPSTGKDGFTSVNVAAVTSSIDNNIKADNIKKDVVILGVTGTLETSGNAGIVREISPQGVYKMPSTSFTFTLPSEAINVGDYGLYFAFQNCAGLTSVDLSDLTTISGYYGMSYAFYDCKGLTSVDLSNLTTVRGYYGMSNAFQNCTSLQVLSFPSLTSTSFGSYTNQFSNMLSGVTGCTVHFPSNLQAVIGSWSSVTSGFGGTNTTVLFDLRATT